MKNGTMLQLFFIYICFPTALTKYTTIDELATRRGYWLEAHTVVTPDGYVLTVHRIPHGRRSVRANLPRLPILLAQGIMMASDTFLYRQRNIAYGLAEAGYDVWFYNYRGNVYSRKHVRLDPDRDRYQFWNYSLTELGTVDLPSVIDYILERTGYDRLSYIGGSMGGTVFWVMSAGRPEYLGRIALMVGVGPVSVLYSLPRFIGFFVDLGMNILESIGVVEVKLYDFAISIGVSVCSSSLWVNQLICDMSARVSRIFDSAITPELIRDGHSFYASGASVKMFQHYVQMARSRKFQYYDYGEVGNTVRYGSPTPALFDLTHFNCSAYVVHSNGDLVASVQDMNIFHKLFTKPPVRILEEADGLSHVGMFVSKRAHFQINCPLLRLIQEKYRCVIQRKSGKQVCRKNKDFFIDESCAVT